MESSRLSQHIGRLAEGSHGDPFSILGRHVEDGLDVFRCYLPRTRNAWLENEDRPMKRLDGTDLFQFTAKAGVIPSHYKVIREDDSGYRHESEDPYSFWPMLDAEEMEAFHHGRHRHAQNLLGARRHVQDGVSGVIFAVWAPNAERVSVVADFNHWDGRCHPMRKHVSWGIWELFVPGVEQSCYKFEIRNQANGQIHLKTDPYARACQLRPETASLVPAAVRHQWQDGDWLNERSKGEWGGQPMSVYEVHLGSWRKSDDGGFLNYRQLGHQLCEYVKELGFTHIELLPIMEHPLDESWGYQTTGYFAPTSRFGTPDDLRAMIDHLHQNGIGVILDWVPAHFPRDAHALAAFDGEALYEYHDPLKAEHKDWGTLVFNYERTEVKSFLISNAIYWLQEFHLDGLRVDAVASMLHLDFSRQSEQWVPNKFGGNENLEAIDFIREMNNAVNESCPGCVMIAEESTDWPRVTGSALDDGLGFHLKWNMGWMHDTLDYFSKETVHRKFHQDLLTFGPMYAFSENFMLPLSHDEVVHLKKSLFGRMPGDDWQKFANLRLLYAYQWTYPGKQLLFMGSEFAQETEWDSKSELPWWRKDQDLPAAVTRLITDLNRLQKSHPALSRWDCDSRGFEWLNGDDAEQSVIAYSRNSESERLLVVLNFTPVPRPGYRIPVIEPARYAEIFNSDAGIYGGSDVLNRQPLRSEPIPMQGREYSVQLDLPPLAAVVLVRT